jgi:hypothetical protein
MEERRYLHPVHKLVADLTGNRGSSYPLIHLPLRVVVRLLVRRRREVALRIEVVVVVAGHIGPDSGPAPVDHIVVGVDHIDLAVDLDRHIGIGKVAVVLLVDRIEIVGSDHIPLEELQEVERIVPKLV